MPDLFGEQEIDDIARNNPARIEPTLNQSISSSYDVAQTSMTVISERYAIWEDITKSAEEAFGTRFPNPMDFAGTGSSRFTEAGTLANIHAAREKLPDPNTFPDYTSQSINKTIRVKRAKAQQRRADISAREGTLGAVLGFGAEAAGIIADPLLLPALLVGAPLSGSIIRAALIEAGIGAAIEVPIQTLIQAGNVSIGERANIGQAVANVAIVGAAAGVLTLALRGLIAGGQKLIARGQADQAVVDAVQELISYEQALRSNPFPDTAHGINQHLARLTEAEAKMHGGRVKADYLNTTAVGSVRGATRFVTQIEVTPTTGRNSLSVKKPIGRVSTELTEDIKSADARAKELDTGLKEAKPGSKIAKALRQEKNQINAELKRLRERERGGPTGTLEIIDDAGRKIGSIKAKLLRKDKKGRTPLDLGPIQAEGRNTFTRAQNRNIRQRVIEQFPKATHIKDSKGRLRPIARTKLPPSTVKVISTLPDIGDKVPRFFAEMSRFAERMKVEVAKKEFIPGPSNLREIRTRTDINDLLSGERVAAAPLNAKGAASVAKAKAEQFDAMATEADAAGRNPVIDMTDETTGRNISKTLKEWQEDIKADELVTRELEKCIALQGITNA